MLLLEAVKQLQTIKPAALQPNVEENEIRPPRNHRGKRLVAVASRAGAMALVLQNARNQFADVRLIVDDQDVGCHAVIVALFPRTIPPRCAPRAAALLFRRRARLRTAIASRRRGRPETSLKHHAVPDVRHAPPKCGRRWRDRGPSPFPGWSHRVPASGRGFLWADRCRCRSHR